MSEPLSVLAERIAALARPLLIALDIDGTVAPIVEDPAQARISGDVLVSLRRLTEKKGICVALVTGRDAAQLDAMDVSAFFRVIEHGRRTLRPHERGAEPQIGELERARLARFREWARACAVPAGARLEEKRASLVVHVRALAERDPAGARALLDRARQAAREMDLVSREGRGVLEAELDGADKGSAVLELLAILGAASCVYAGDDRTDEGAIARASERGLGLFVRSTEQPEPPPDTAATLAGPAEVAELLRLLAHRL